MSVSTRFCLESLSCPLLYLIQHLSDTYFGVRNKCLQLLGCLGTVDTPLTKDGEGLSTGMTAGMGTGKRTTSCAIWYYTRITAVSVYCCCSSSGYVWGSVCQGRPEYHQRLLWRPGSSSAHSSHQGHGMTSLPTAEVVDKVQSAWSRFLVLLSFLLGFQLQLHERGMKIQQNIYEHVRI